MMGPFDVGACVGCEKSCKAPSHAGTGAVCSVCETKRGVAIYPDLAARVSAHAREPHRVWRSEIREKENRN